MHSNGRVVTHFTKDAWDVWALDWREAATWGGSQGTYDVLLGSDLIYDWSQVVWLVGAATALAAEQCTFYYVAPGVRSGMDVFVRAMGVAGWKAETSSNGTFVGGLRGPTLRQAWTRRRACSARWSRISRSEEGA